MAHMVVLYTAAACLKIAKGCRHELRHLIHLVMLGTRLLKGGIEVVYRHTYLKPPVRSRHVCQLFAL